MDQRTNELKKQMVNFPEWYDYMLSHPLTEELVTAIWDSTGNSDHGHWVEEMRNVIYDRGFPHNISVLYREFSGLIHEDTAWMLDRNVKMCNISLARFDLRAYFKRTPIVSTFCDEVFIVNSAGNYYDEPTQHPAPPPELTVGACDYNSMIRSKIAWLEYSNHEEGFEADTYGFSNWWLEKYGMVLTGTSASSPFVFFAIILPIFHFYLYNLGRIPTTTEANNLTYINNYIPFDSKIGELRMCTLPKLEDMFMEKKVTVEFTEGNADYNYNDEHRILMAYDNPDDDIPAQPLPFVMDGGHTMVPLVVVKEILEDMGISVSKVWDYNNRRATLICTTKVPNI